MVFNYSPNGRDVLSVIMCFPMTLLTNYEYQNTKHASSFFFLMNLTNLVGCLWQRQEVRVNLRKGNSDGARVLTSHDCGVPFLDLVLHVDLLCFWFIFLLPWFFFSNLILCPSTTEPDTSKFYLREVTQLRSKLATGYSYFTSLTINSDRSGQGSNKEPFNLSS